MENSSLMAKRSSLFKMMKTSQKTKRHCLGLQRDNVAFVKDRVLNNLQKLQTNPTYEVKQFDSVISLKAETHNFPRL
jgi:phosphoribosylformylglycinamidine synthase